MYNESIEKLSSMLSNSQTEGSKNGLLEVYLRDVAITKKKSKEVGKPDLQDIGIKSISLIAHLNE